MKSPNKHSSSREFFQKRTAILFGLLAIAVRAHADPPIAQLVGARLYLSTTSMSVDVISSTQTQNGFVVRRGAFAPARITLRARILTGYIRTTNLDPKIIISTGTQPADIARRGKISFVEERDLIRIKYPRPGLVSTNVQDLYISTSIISKIERYIGPFDGYSAYGEPFFLPEWQGRLLSGDAPVYHCTPPTERQELVWVSYNKNVGEVEMAPICEAVDFESQTLKKLMANEKVFGVIYPAD